MPKWLNGVVTRIQDLTPNLRIFDLSVQLEKELTFIPGQFVVMDLPIGPKRLDRWRSYSIANTPNSANKLEFCVVRVPNGPATGYLFEELDIGTTVKMKYPDGTFSILNHLDYELVLVCTGTGVAPFRSMLSYIKEHKLSFRKIHLIFGTRYKSGILYMEEFENMARENQNFTYDVALSREAFNGYQGYVHNIYMEHYLSPVRQRRFYLCGWQNMIDEAVANLVIKAGYEHKQVQYELYG